MKVARNMLVFRTPGASFRRDAGARSVQMRRNACLVTDSMGRLARARRETLPRLAPVRRLIDGQAAGYAAMPASSAPQVSNVKSALGLVAQSTPSAPASRRAANGAVSELSETPSAAADGAVSGVRLYRAIDDYLARQARLPPSGMTGFDPRLSPAWAGLQIPG
jgi:hypothetical protein